MASQAIPCLALVQEVKSPLHPWISCCRAAGCLDCNLHGLWAKKLIPASTCLTCLCVLLHQPLSQLGQHSLSSQPVCDRHLSIEKHCNHKGFPFVFSGEFINKAKWTGERKRFNCE